MNTATTKERIHEISPRFEASEARFAGCLYLLIILGGLFAPFAIAPAGMMLGEAALPTTAKILAEKPLYVIGWGCAVAGVHMRYRRGANLLRATEAGR